MSLPWSQKLKHLRETVGVFFVFFRQFLAFLKFIPFLCFVNDIKTYHLIF